jgi:DNA-binding MarR family transcriptional regulator
MNLEVAVADYIEQVTGERPEMTPLSADAVDRLPVYLGRAWDLRKMHLLGREVILALPKGGTKTGLARLAKDHAALVSRLESEVIAVLPDIRSYERRQLVQKRLPFVAPGRQLFLPMFLADFRETFSVPAHRKAAESMSWIAQLIILRHLVNGEVAERPLAEVAETLGYTPMAVTHGVKELVALELCTKVPKGRAKTIKFNLEFEALWERALVHMRSPAGRRYPVVAADGTIPAALDAGLTALSGKTGLAYNGPRMVALPNREVKRLLSDKRLETRVDEEDAECVLEGWSYNPQLLSSGPAVDELSLYLSLKDDSDERVQLALADMMEQRKW